MVPRVGRGFENLQTSSRDVVSRRATRVYSAVSRVTILYRRYRRLEDARDARVRAHVDAFAGHTVDGDFSKPSFARARGSPRSDDAVRRSIGGTHASTRGAVVLGVVRSIGGARGVARFGARARRGGGWRVESTPWARFACPATGCGGRRRSGAWRILKSVVRRCRWRSCDRWPS